MKHYICVEKHEITYICGKYKATGGLGSRGTIVIQDVIRVPAGGDIQELFAGLARTHGLSGRKVDLVLGREISCMKALLPKSGDRTIRRMACNQLIAEGRCGTDCLAAVDIQRVQGERRVPVMVYYVARDKLDPYTAAMEQAGILLGRTLLMPHCTAAASQLLHGSRFDLVIDVEKEGLSLYAVSAGHCLAWKSMPLQSGRFCERGEEVLLYEEAAEQAEHILRQFGKDQRISGPESIVLEGNGIPNAGEAAAFLERHFALPCRVAEFDISLEPDASRKSDARPEEGKEEAPGDETPVSPGPLSVIVAESRCAPRSLRLKPLKDGEGAGPLKWLSAVISRNCALFLLANVVIAGGAYGYMESMSRRTYQEMLDLRDAMNAPDYRERCRSIQTLDSQMVEEITRRNRDQEVRKAAASYLKKEDFEAFTDAMEPGMEIEAVVYERKGGPYLELMVSQSNASKVPSFVGRVKESGVFEDVRHTMWEKRENEDGPRVHVTVRGDLKKEGQDEIQ